jgi:hypothetical protein
MVAPPFEAPLMEEPPQILILKSEPLERSPIQRTKNNKPLSGGKLGSYQYLFFCIALIIFTLAYLLLCITIAL